MSGSPGMVGGSAGFSTKSGDHAVGIDRHHAKAGGFGFRHDKAAHGHIRARIDVLLQHQFVVHLVDVVAREDDHVFRRVGGDDVDVLVNRVGGAFVPLAFRHALRCGQDVEAFVTFRPHEVPRAVHVADQRVRLVLRGHADAADARIDRVRQREVDDPAHPAEIDRRLGAVVGQFFQAAAAPTRQHIGHRIARQRLPSCPVPHPRSPSPKLLLPNVLEHHCR